MKRLPSLIVALTLMFACVSTHAQIGGYRVEVIIFQNLLANIDAVEVDKLQSFAAVPGLQEESLPDELEVLTDRSQRMEGVWRRLRNSKGYRPLVYSSWVQNNIDYNPPFRIHDDVIIDTQIRSPTRMVVADLGAQDPLKAYRNDFYRLDGSVQLRRSRFLHISLDLEYRVPAAVRPQQNDIYDPSGTDTLIDAGSPGVDTMVNTDQPGAGTLVNSKIDSDLSEHDVYRLKQSRQVKTDRLQYFDSPWFGALVLVIPIAAEPIAALPIATEPLQ